MTGDPVQDQVTQLLNDFDLREDAAAELLPLVYEQLRSIARGRMGRERNDHTLQATALVHEVFMKLVGDRDAAWENRRHFFGVAAEAMRRILIDHARKRGSRKRGGGAVRSPINVIDLAVEQDPDQVIALDEALQRLDTEDPRAAEVVKLRFYAGLSVDETAGAMGIARRTVLREWAFARARLFELLDGESGADDSSSTGSEDPTADSGA